MNELTHERSRVRANIVINALAIHHVGKNMDDFVKKSSHINGNIVTNALTSHQIVGDRNTHTQEITINMQAL